MTVKELKLILEEADEEMAVCVEDANTCVIPIEEIDFHDYAWCFCIGGVDAV